ncbi:MAG: hypothetical protein C0515_06050 [Novosphingobium sp.]|nr:hypothetical protein [Novosphingobium sp.]
MEFANDFMTALRGRVAPAGAATGNTGFDWSGLHARLVAAHAARAELARSDSRPVLLDGGFTDWAAAGHSRSKDECAVNPADSTDGKGPCAITDAEAGQDMAGGRGQ